MVHTARARNHVRWSHGVWYVKMYGTYSSMHIHPASGAGVWYVKTYGAYSTTIIKNKNMENFGLNQEIAGKPMMQYMADLLELNDNQQIEIERGKMAVAILKQMNNLSRIQLDAAKFELKKMFTEKEINDAV